MHWFRAGCFALAAGVLAISFATPSLADGGRGGDEGGFPGGGGGGGGADSATGTGGAGVAGDPASQFAGGGGGGAGVIGGAGGVGAVGGGAGGAGGVHGYVGSTLPSGPVTGTNGGDGVGSSDPFSGAGGGGGGGGYGAVVTGAGASGLITGDIIAGDGGAGGAGSFFDGAGAGGSGGIGLLLMDGSLPSTLTISAAIRGGDGGGNLGSPGFGGIGLAGSNLALTINGSISGGLSGDGSVRSSSIVFSGGVNSLTFGNATSGLTGDIGIISGSLTFAQPTDVTVASAITGAGSVAKTGAGTLVLTGASSFSGDFTLDGGTVRAGHDSALGAGLLLVKSGTLDIAHGVSIGNTAVLENDFSINVGFGAAASYGGDILESSGSSFGVSKTGGGTLRLSGANNYSGATIVDGGVLLIQSDGALPNATNVTVNAGATLQIEDMPINPWIGSLAGAGDVVIGTDSILTIGFNPVATVFSGTITGNGSLAMEGPGQLKLTGTSTIGGVLTMCSSCSSSLLEIDGGSLTVGDPLGAGGGIGLTGGTLRVVNGGTLHMVDPSGILAVQSIMEVSGAGSTVTSEGFTGIGGAGAAGITISAGGVVNSRGGAAIEGFDVSSMVTVTGAGSTWNVDNGLFVAGYVGFGTGTLVISSGGVVNSTAFTQIGSDPDPVLGLATASVTVTGAGSTLNADNGLVVGHPGCGCGGADYAGILTVADGGAVNAAAGMEIGAGGTLNLGTGGLAGSLVTPTLSNDGRIVADFTDSATLAADISGLGTLTKQGSGTLTLTGANSYTGPTFLNGGILSVSSDANLGHADATLALDGGVLRVTGTGFTQANRAITFGANGGGFDIVDAANTFTVTQSFAGAGGLSKAGAGTLLLTGAQAYSGATSITGGTLRAGAAGAFSASSAFTVNAGATLDLGGINQSLGSLAGSGSVALGPANLAVGANSGSTSFAGVISGTGSLTKQGSGTLTLTGANNYSGGTTISGGTLVGNTTSLPGAILNNAALVFDQAAGGTFAGAISGSGTLTKQGAGALTLTGANSYSGGTTIAAGTLVGSTASLQGAILNNAALVFDQAVAGTFAGVISGPGTLTKRGAGVLTLTGTNLYTGTTFLNGGVLNVTSDANLGAASAALAFDGGALRIGGTGFNQTGRAITLGAGGGTFDIADAAARFTLAQSITGTGGFSKAGAGSLSLTGANSYSGGTTISGGTLIGNSASLQGPILNNAALVFDQAATGTFAGVISGPGTLTKRGAGTLTLSGASTMSGQTRIEAGLLVLNGSLANSVVTLTGGALGGNGTVGGLVAQAGTVAPGNSIGTLSALGNVGFGPAATYQIEINAAGASDRIVTTGSALLVGGRVQVLAATGAYAQSTRYGILTAQGGISGRFASVTSDLAFLTPVLSYDPTAVVLTMTRNDTDFGPQPTPDGGSPRAFVAATRNQAGVASAAQSLGSGNRVYDTLLGTTADQARAGFDLLSGEAHAQAVSVAIENSHLIRESILNRLRAPFGSAAPAGSVQGAFAADLPGRKSVTAMPAPAFEARRFSLWGEAIGAQGSIDRDGNAASLSYRGGGMLLGAELEQGQWRVGVAGGYTKTDFDVDARRANGELSSFHGALYGGARIGAVALRAGAAYSWSDVDTRRGVSFPGFGDYLRLDGNSATAQAFAEVGYGLTLGQVSLEPFAQLAAVNIRTERNTEQGGAAALTVLGRDQTLGFTTLGLRGEMQLGALPLVARGMLGWRYAFGDVTPTADLAFVAGGLPFRTYAAPVARNTLVAEAGLAWKVSGATTLGISYGAAISDKARDQSLKGRIDIAF